MIFREIIYILNSPDLSHQQPGERQTLTPEALQAVKSSLGQIEQALPFLVGLTPGERVSFPKISVSNKAFTEDTITAVVNNAALLHSFVNQLAEKPADTKTQAAARLKLCFPRVQQS